MEAIYGWKNALIKSKTWLINANNKQAMRIVGQNNANSKTEPIIFIK